MSNTLEGPASQPNSNNAMDNNDNTEGTAGADDILSVTRIIDNSPNFHALMPFRFTDLPAEIRHMVWNQAMIDVPDTYFGFRLDVTENRVKVGGTTMVSYGVVFTAFTNSKAIPRKHLDLMGVCVESRQEMLKLMHTEPITVHYKPSFSQGRKFVELPCRKS